jgi:ribosomal protein S18 acetylase RimI-like enzyme
MSQFTLRPLVADDIEAAVELTRALRDWFPPDCLEEVREYARRLPGLVAANEAGEIAGYVVWQEGREEWEVHYLGVARELHRQGLGRKLLEQLLASAREKGARWLRIGTVAPTEHSEPYIRTRTFYEALGFTLQSMEPSGWEDGMDRADYLMEIS